MAIQPPSGFETIERRTVTTEAIAQITRLVASRALSPGQKLPPERELSELLGVSRPSVREAVRALATMGILETRHGTGTYVTALSPSILAHPFAFVLDANPHALSDLFEVRLMLEVGAAELAAQQIGDETLDRLQEILSSLNTIVDDIEAFCDADITFHRTIHEASRNDLLLALMDSLVVLGRHSRLITGQNREVRDSTVLHHGEIYGALKRHDPANAGIAMRTHLAHVRKYYHQVGE